LRNHARRLIPRAFALHWRAIIAVALPAIFAPCCGIMPDQAVPAPKPNLTSMTCRVTPNAKRSEFSGWTMDEKGRPVLLLRLQAPPVDGKANAELLRFLAEALDCPRAAVTLLRGATSKLKVVELPADAADRATALALNRTGRD
jgi:uncharacterized protein